ncbi:hypothetical protein ACHAWF_002101, partial [Thalassiosira exigua]
PLAHDVALLAQQELPHPLERDPRLHDLVDDLGQHEQREPQHVEQRQRRQRLGHVQVVPPHSVRRERRQRDEERGRAREELGAKVLLPRLDLDDAQCPQDLVVQGHPHVPGFHEHILDPTEPRGDVSRVGDEHDDDDHFRQAARSHMSPQKVHRQPDLEERVSHGVFTPARASVRSPVARRLVLDRQRRQCAPCRAHLALERLREKLASPSRERSPPKDFGVVLGSNPERDARSNPRVPRQGVKLAKVSCESRQFRSPIPPAPSPNPEPDAVSVVILFVERRRAFSERKSPGAIGRAPNPPEKCFQWPNFERLALPLLIHQWSRRLRAPLNEDLVDDRPQAEAAEEG